MKKKALFPGAFDPFTIGHDALVKRGLSIVDEIIIAIGYNSGKKTLFSLEERLSFVKKIYKDEKRISVTSYDMLTVDFAKQEGINFILRGIRNINDFDYEKNMAYMNRQLSEIETVFLFSQPEYVHISSNLVRELIYFKKDITNLIPSIK